MWVTQCPMSRTHSWFSGPQRAAAFLQLWHLQHTKAYLLGSGLLPSTLPLSLGNHLMVLKFSKCWDLHRLHLNQWLPGFSSGTPTMMCGFHYTWDSTFFSGLSSLLTAPSYSCSPWPRQTQTRTTWETPTLPSSSASVRCHLGPL